MDAVGRRERIGARRGARRTREECVDVEGRKDQEDGEEQDAPGKSAWTWKEGRMTRGGEERIGARHTGKGV